VSPAPVSLLPVSLALVSLALVSPPVSGFEVSCFASWPPESLPPFFPEPLPPVFGFPVEAEPVEAEFALLATQQTVPPVLDIAHEVVLTVPLRMPVHVVAPTPVGRQMPPPFSHADPEPGWGGEVVPESTPPVVVSHFPPVHESEQQSPKFVQLWPAPLQTVPAPPHTPLSQLALQHSALPVHCAPSAPQLGATQTPPEQLPVQQAAPVPQRAPAGEQVFESAGAAHRPEHDVLQHSSNDEHCAPSSRHWPPMPWLDVPSKSWSTPRAQPKKRANGSPVTTRSEAAAFRMRAGRATDVPIDFPIARFDLFCALVCARDAKWIACDRGESESGRRDPGCSRYRPATGNFHPCHQDRPGRT
jgi:hypothetical protein